MPPWESFRKQVVLSLQLLTRSPWGWYWGAQSLAVTHWRPYLWTGLCSGAFARCHPQEQRY